MSTEISLNPAAFLVSESLDANAASLGLAELKSLAIDGLASMFDAERGLFCYRLRQTRRGVVREGVSHRYTVMALLGLHAVESQGGQCRLPLDAMLETCVRNTQWIGGVGDVGLLTWLLAERAPELLPDFFRRMDLETCLDRFQDARESRTMELAWFLTGLCSAASATPDSPWPLDDLCLQTYLRLQENHHESGLLGHCARKSSVSGLLRGRIGSLADQVYSIYGFVKFARAFNVEEPLDAALECAAMICRLQGPLGQWWWGYDACAGRVLCRYPIFSVEQYGIAPLALLALEESTGHQFHPAVQRGMRWICGSNELGVDLRSPWHRLIWSRIAPANKCRTCWDTALNVLLPSRQWIPRGPLRVLCESRPYELGLLLYSFAQARPERVP